MSYQATIDIDMDIGYLLLKRYICSYLPVEYSCPVVDGRVMQYRKGGYNVMRISLVLYRALLPVRFSISVETCHVVIDTYI